MRGLLGFALLFAGLALLPTIREPFGIPVSYLVFLGVIWFWVAQATSWNILSGYSGYFSFGQAAFLAVGAYTTAVLFGRHGVDFFLTIPIAGLLSLLLALAIGALAFRLRSLRGEIFALLTLAVPFVLESVILISPAIDGGQGIVIPLPGYPDVIGSFQDLVYLLFLAVGVGALATAFATQHSRLGWGLFAIHDAEDVAEGLGVPTFRQKMVAIGLNGLIGGIGGSIFALQIGFVAVQSVFGLTVPLFVIVMSVLGGRSHWLGPLIGAVVIVTLQDRLSASGFEGWSLVILGTILAVLVIVAPEGLYARLRRRPRPVVAALIGAGRGARGPGCLGRAARLGPCRDGGRCARGAHPEDPPRADRPRRCPRLRTGCVGPVSARPRPGGAVAGEPRRRPCVDEHASGRCRPRGGRGGTGGLARGRAHAARSGHRMR